MHSNPTPRRRMPSTSFDKDSRSGHASTTDLESSDASDKSRVISHPTQKRNDDEKNTFSTSRSRDYPRPVPDSAKPQSGSKSRRHAQASESPANLMEKGATSRSVNQTPNPITPSKGSGIALGTPSSRHNAIESAFKKMAIGTSPTPTPTRSTTTPQSQRRVIIIDDSDEDEALTDIELTMPPTPASSFYERPTPIEADSSQSSMNSLFSHRSAASSVSSLETSFAESSTNGLSRNTRPARVEDVFQAPTSPNVTTRKPQRPNTKSQGPQSIIQPDFFENIPHPITQFARSSFGVDLEEVFIAHCDQTQRLMDSHRIDWGTQYELARGVSTGAWTWTDVREHVEQLGGRNIDSAFKVQRVMRGRSVVTIQPSDLFLWKELDREQAAIMENQSRGLGLMGPWEGSPDWYGGQIQQLARLVKKSDTYALTLEPMEKRRSHRFARFYGSRRFLQLKIPEDILRKENAQVKRFLTKKFVLCGRVFVPFHSKDHGLYMVETSDNYGRSSQDWCGDQFRLSFQEFINWHNPLEQTKNYHQVISKYATRFALGLSNSVPALEFEEQDIIFIDDLTASGWPKGQKNPPANQLMTDGCGFLNHTALYQIVKYLGYENLPAGVQGRIDGSKGFWILHPSDNSSEPKVWIRNSQNKIKNSSFDRAHRIFDLLCPSRPSPPIALTQQSIINVFANGIPSDVLVRLMEEGLEEEVAPLLEWEKPNAMVLLWNAINKCGNVSGTRTQRLSSSLNRALGLKGRDWGPDDIGADPDDTQADDDAPFATYTGRNKDSGAPLALHELAMELIQSGFHPSRNKPLNDKIGYIIKTVIKTSVEKYRISIKESLGAFVVPDPLGVLKEGEIYYRFSRPRKDPKTEMLLHVLEGDIVLGRYPIRLPSDMQRVKAVDRRELDKWPDVIIISTQGKRSLASLLADGDMDGDELIAIWDREIVESFDSKPFTDAPLDLIESNFEPSGKVESVEGFCERTGTLSPRQASGAFLEHLIANLNESQVGLYSMMHENATVAYGYEHLHSVRLAYIFATLLDSSKTGHRLKTGILERDLRKFGKSSKEESTPPPNDILGLLRAAATKKGDVLTARYQAQVIPQSENKIKQRDNDKDLLQPYDKFSSLALQAYDQYKIRAYTDELSAIRKHVDVAWNLYTKAMDVHRSRKELESPTKGGKSRRAKSDKEDLMLAPAHAYAQPIENILLIQNLEQVKASYAYKLSEPFAYSVAFQEVCHIKVVAAPGGHAPTLRIFDEGKSFSTSFLRALNRRDEV